MRRATLAAAVIVLLTAVPIPAAHIFFENASYTLPQDAAAFSVNLMASGDERVLSVDLYLNIQDNGPLISGVELNDAGLIFAGGDAETIVPALPARVVYASTALDPPTPPALAPLDTGTLAIITLSTVGISPGQYTFSLTVDAEHSSDLVSDGGQYLLATLDGTTLNVVPEPGVWIQLLGLIGVAPAVLLLRRKFGK